MIIVTGAAGFIGCNLIKGLNFLGFDNILAVDDLTNGQQFHNLAAVKIADYLDKSQLRSQLPQLLSQHKIDAILHQGACSDTTCWDGKYMLDNNYQYSKELLHLANTHNIPFLYASSAAVYGSSDNFADTQSQLKPLNVYGYSKWLFDIYVKSQNWDIPVYGLRYFNVYGPHENHKGKMASVAYHLYQQYQRGESIKLFGSYAGYEAGAQMRDFIYVDDVIKVNLWLLKKQPQSGVYNCGTGKAQTFNDLASALRNRYPDAKLEYIDFPEHLKNAYQNYTQADMTSLRQLGYDQPFANVEQGVEQYLEFLEQQA